MSSHYCAFSFGSSCVVEADVQEKKKRKKEKKNKQAAAAVEEVEAEGAMDADSMAVDEAPGAYCNVSHSVPAVLTLRARS